VSSRFFVFDIVKQKTKSKNKKLITAKNAKKTKKTKNASGHEKGKLQIKTW